VINELSFLGQAENNYDEADNLMRVVFEIIEALNHIYKGITIRIHSDFYVCKISKNLTVQQWLKNKQNLKLKFNNNNFRLFLEKTGKTPFIDRELKAKLEENNRVFRCSFNNTDVSESSLAGIIYFQISENITSKIISLQNAPDFSNESITVEFTIDENSDSITIHNFTDVSQPRNSLPKYEASPRHRQQGERGKKGTLMDLSDIEAQEVLDESYINNWFEGKKFYGYKNGKFYEFQKTDNAGTYHGYPVKRDEVPHEVREEMKL
jgi:hypothetical protein